MKLHFIALFTSLALAHGLPQASAAKGSNTTQLGKEGSVGEPNV